MKVHGRMIVLCAGVALFAAAAFGAERYSLVRTFKVDGRDVALAPGEKVLDLGRIYGSELRRGEEGTRWAPGETEADFEATRTLMDEAGFDNAFIFKYSPRPGTRSAALPDDVPVSEKERRDQVLLADQERRGQARNDKLIGTVREVMAEGPSKRNKARWSGRDGGNRIVVWDVQNGEAISRSLQRSGQESPRIAPALQLALLGGYASPNIGDLVKLRIVEAHPQILIGTL